MPNHDMSDFTQQTVADPDLELIREKGEGDSLLCPSAMFFLT